MSSVCRICLAGNTSLHSVKNNKLRSLYEKLTNAKFNSDDARPRALCCFCYQKLLRCHTFSQMALTSEKIFRDLYDNDLEVTHEHITEVNMKHHLSVATMQIIIIDRNVTNAVSQVPVKDEPQPSIDIKEEVTTEPDELVDKDCINSQLTLNEQNSDQGNGVSELHYNTHVEQTKPENANIQFNCKNCNRTFQRKSNLTTHIKRSHYPLNEENSDQWNGVSELHYNTHVEPTKPENANMQFNCKNCNRTFQRKSNLTTHIKRSHYQLKEMQYSSTQKQTGTTCMPEDKIIHNLKNKFACHVCNKTFSYKHSYVCHLRTHTLAKPYACNVCDKQFNQKCHLVYHMRTHTGETPFACTVCDKQFNRKDHLVSHMRIHTGEKPFACNICDKQFYPKCNLVSHMRTHTGEKPFACNVCDKQFTIKGSLVVHMRIHTLEKPFACKVCDKQFTNKCTLRVHMTIHTLEKQYVCNVCGKQCNRKDNLDSHMRIHTVEKQYVCNVCGKQCNRKDNLVSHMRTHTVEKPYACNVCEKQFKRKDNLVTHMRNTHKLQKHPKPVSPRARRNETATLQLKLTN